MSLLLLFSGRAHHANVLALARRSLENGELYLAVIMAQTACELRMEAAIADLLRMRGADYLEEAVGDLLGTFNPSNPRVRKLYTALSGDPLQQASPWPEYKEHTKRRNKVVHEASSLASGGAARSVEIVEALIKHIDEIVENLAAANPPRGLV